VVIPPIGANGAIDPTCPTLLTGSTNDLIALSGLTNDSITIDGSNDFLIFTGGCGTTSRTVVGNLIGTKSAPITVC
jgi:hypothetical protein